LKSGDLAGRPTVEPARLASNFQQKATSASLDAGAGCSRPVGLSLRALARVNFQLSVFVDDFVGRAQEIEELAKSNCAPPQRSHLRGREVFFFHSFFHFRIRMNREKSSKKSD
jgi:hypothetical protein